MSYNITIGTKNEPEAEFKALVGGTVSNVYYNYIGHPQSCSSYDDGKYLMIDYINGTGELQTLSLIATMYKGEAVMKIVGLGDQETRDLFYGEKEEEEEEEDEQTKKENLLDMIGQVPDTELAQAIDAQIPDYLIAEDFDLMIRARQDRSLALVLASGLYDSPTQEQFTQMVGARMESSLLVCLEHGWFTPAFIQGLYHIDMPKLRQELTRKGHFKMQLTEQDMSISGLAQAEQESVANLLRFDLDDGTIARALSKYSLDRFGPQFMTQLVQAGHEQSVIQLLKLGNKPDSKCIKLMISANMTGALSTCIEQRLISRELAQLIYATDWDTLHLELAETGLFRESTV